MTPGFDECDFRGQDGAPCGYPAICYLLWVYDSSNGVHMEEITVRCPRHPVNDYYKFRPLSREEAFVWIVLNA